MLMFFPLNYIYHNVLIVILGSYQYDVLTEKIDMIAEKLANYSEATKEYLEWESGHFVDKPLIGTFKEDDYRLSNQMGNRGTLIFFAPLVFFRPLILVISPLLLLLALLEARPFKDFLSWEIADYTSFLLFLVSLVVFIFGVYYPQMPSERFVIRLSKNLKPWQSQSR